MVRLKVLLIQQMPEFLQNFNSLMVRLKVTFSQYGVWGGLKFQFLNGSIKRLY